MPTARGHSTSHPVHKSAAGPGARGLHPPHQQHRRGVSVPTSQRQELAISTEALLEESTTAKEAAD